MSSTIDDKIFLTLVIVDIRGEATDEAKKLLEEDPQRWREALKKILADVTATPARNPEGRRIYVARVQDRLTYVKNLTKIDWQRRAENDEVYIRELQELGSLMLDLLRTHPSSRVQQSLREIERKLSKRIGSHGPEQLT